VALLNKNAKFILFVILLFEMFLNIGEVGRLAPIVVESPQRNGVE